jgi:hypothetical protein
MPLDTHPPFSCNGFCIISLPMSASISEMALVWLVWWVCPDVLCTLFNELTPAPIIRDGSTVFLKTSSEVSILTVVYLAAWICLNPSLPIPSAKEKQPPKPRNDWFYFFSKALSWPIKDISMQVSTQPHFAFCTHVCVCLYMNCSNKQNTHFLLPSATMCAFQIQKLATFFMQQRKCHNHCIANVIQSKLSDASFLLLVPEKSKP